MAELSVHQPECNIWCNERGHWLLSSGPQGEPFSHQDEASRQRQVAMAARTRRDYQRYARGGIPRSAATTTGTRPNGNAASRCTGPATCAPTAASRCGGGR